MLLSTIPGKTQTLLALLSAVLCGLERAQRVGVRYRLAFTESLFNQYACCGNMGNSSI
jgi:hypothetical protein